MISLIVLGISAGILWVLYIKLFLNKIPTVQTKEELVLEKKTKENHLKLVGLKEESEKKKEELKNANPKDIEDYWNNK